MRRARPLPYFAEAPITTIVAVVVTAAVAIDGIAALVASPLSWPAQALCKALIAALACLAIFWEIAGPAPVLIPVLRRIFRRRR
jgi:hypothetical protein